MGFPELCLSQETGHGSQCKHHANEGKKQRKNQRKKGRKEGRKEGGRKIGRKEERKKGRKEERKKGRKKERKEERKIQKSNKHTIEQNITNHKSTRLATNHATSVSHPVCVPHAELLRLVLWLILRLASQLRRERPSVLRCLGRSLAERPQQRYPGSHFKQA